MVVTCELSYWSFELEWAAIRHVDREKLEGNTEMAQCHNCQPAVTTCSMVDYSDWDSRCYAPLRWSVESINLQHNIYKYRCHRRNNDAWFPVQLFKSFSSLLCASAATRRTYVLLLHQHPKTIPSNSDSAIYLLSHKVPWFPRETQWKELKAWCRQFP